MSANDELIRQAVGFLSDPTTASFPLDKKISFLEGKGLDPAQIQQALASAGQSQHVSPAPMSATPMPYIPQQPPTPVQRHELDRDWRDWFIMSVIGGSVGYVAIKLAQKYLLPHLEAPSQTQLEQAQKELEAKYDEAALTLQEIQESTSAVAAAIDEQKTAVDTELESLRVAIADIKKGELEREQWCNEISEKVRAIADDLPKALDRHATTHVKGLDELQAELKSLKSLVSPASRTPSLPVNAPSRSPLTNTSSTFALKPPGIPAWQLSSATPATDASSSPPTPLTPSTPAEGTAV